jgi:hypothetical protein
MNKLSRHVAGIKGAYHSLLGKKLSGQVGEKAGELVGSFKKGGKVKKTGLARVHAGEVVLSKAAVATLRKHLK